MPSKFQGRSRAARIPQVPRQTLRPEPPRKFSRILKAKRMQGPGIAPKGFVKATTSRSEWFIYWALLRILGPAGENEWGFQISSNNGGAIIDFVIWKYKQRLAFRVQSERFHLATASEKHRYDILQRQMLERSGYKVVELYEEHFLKDESGQAAIKLVKLALKGIEKPSPITYKTGQSRPARIG